jgi:PAS domain S-box-containing protein
MQFSLKTKLTLATSLLVFVVVLLISGLYVSRLTRQVIRQSDDRAQFVAQQIFHASQQALSESAERGETPASSSAVDLRTYVRHSLLASAGLNTLLESSVGFSRTIYEITITDQQGTALISSDSALPGRIVFQRPDLRTLVEMRFLGQLRVLYGPPSVYEVVLPFNLGGKPYGAVRVGISSALLRDEVAPGLNAALWVALAAVVLSTALVFLLSHLLLSPLGRISAQLDRISAGEFDWKPLARGDELGQVSTKISRIGQQLRDVREIFSTMRENLNQIMTGLEDGLLLFNADGRAVLVSPSAEKFLGARADAVLGRSAHEVFPAGHPLSQALHFEADALVPVENAEVRLETADGPRRVGASVQAITENGRRMATLLTLRDLESLDRIGSQLQVSERLAALGRVTAGVAHEVKNPLNAMRVWLEILKANLPSGAEPQQAVKVLDSEIDRLDRVVKTFLDFTRPVELKLEETNLAELLGEVLALASPQIAAANVEVQAEMSGGLPPANVDRQLIKQAILNLVMNACQAMSGGGRLTVALRRRGEMAEISIGDTGPGIPPEHQKKVFQLFFTMKPGGTGLGLATCFQIVQLHNGSIDFSSEVGRGTTFRMELPLSR